ncbi:MAG: hypothetical protein H6993_12615 [Pseudomonadales bacterium]|nr:hypothetical protein [Pseudomonadales bacterium]MCP5184800.1 hypothetical protein [Pseudomonadales bacterium]
MGKRTLVFVVAWLATFALGATAATQVVLAFLESLGRTIPFGERAAAVAHDLGAMFPAYGGLLLIALLIAFPVVGLIVRGRPALRLVGYVVGGFVAVLALHLIMRSVLGMNPVWATGTPFGLLLQCLSGAVGGYLFARLQRPVVPA